MQMRAQIQGRGLLFLRSHGRNPELLGRGAGGFGRDWRRGRQGTGVVGGGATGDTGLRLRPQVTPEGVRTSGVDRSPESLRAGPLEPRGRAPHGNRRGRRRSEPNPRGAVQPQKRRGAASPSPYANLGAPRSAPARPAEEEAEGGTPGPVRPASSRRPRPERPPPAPPAASRDARPAEPRVGRPGDLLCKEVTSGPGLSAEGRGAQLGATSRIGSLSDYRGGDLASWGRVRTVFPVFIWDAAVSPRGF